MLHGSYTTSPTSRSTYVHWLIRGVRFRLGRDGGSTWKLDVVRYKYAMGGWRDEADEEYICLPCRCTCKVGDRECGLDVFRAVKRSD
jgi:hypothetical protein